MHFLFRQEQPFSRHSFLALALHKSWSTVLLVGDIFGSELGFTVGSADGSAVGDDHLSLEFQVHPLLVQVILLLILEHGLHFLFNQEQPFLRHSFWVLALHKSWSTGLLVGDIVGSELGFEDGYAVGDVHLSIKFQVHPLLVQVVFLVILVHDLHFLFNQ